jgi:hypothetical protein
VYTQYWDLRQQNPALSVEVPQKVYSMDVVYPLMVVACADRYVDIFDLRKPNVPTKVKPRRGGGVRTVYGSWAEPEPFLFFE